MNKIIDDFLNSKLRIKQFCNENKINLNQITKELENLGYVFTTRQSGETIRKIKIAVEEYKNNKRTHSQIAKKYDVSPNTLKAVLKKLNLLDLSRTKRRYNEYTFDSIDTEEKAYWLGYIFADGYIYKLKPRTNGQIDYNFELCSKGDDINHMQKFANLMEYEGTLKVTPADKNGHTRCRVCFSSKHLWETLNSYGCTPQKSLSLQFPDEGIFKSKDLIRHFIRGYFDGDGCISYGNKEHNLLSIQLLGTKLFLSKILDYTNVNANLHHNHNNIHETTMFFSISAKKAFNFIKLLYNNSKIYLQRKFDRYCYFCRLYEESDRLLETKIMEGCDANHEVNSEIKESESLQRVGIEPEKPE